MKIQSIKRIKLNKIGTVATVFILCCISFTAGVDLTQNANSAGSASVLPVNKGGTGGNTASIAAANILGTNFSNYDGILPLTKGGLGVNANTNDGKNAARNNLKLPLTERYDYEESNTWVKVASQYVMVGGNSYTYYSVWKITMMGELNSSIAPQELILFLGGTDTSDVHSYDNSSYVNLSPRCTKAKLYITSTTISDTQKLFNFYLERTSHVSEVMTTREMAANIGGGARVAPFTPEKLYAAPENSVTWEPTCLSFQSTPAPPPTPPVTP
jgi:hypothetical protein